MTMTSELANRKKILNAFNLEFLKLAGYSRGQMRALGDLSKLTSERMLTLIHDKTSEALVADLRRQRVRTRVLSPKRGRRKKNAG
jgi:lipopolysaccharide export system protein LptC